MFFLIIYSLLRRVVGLAAPDGILQGVLAENMVLRHRLVVEARGAPRPKLRRRDRLFFVALSRVLPRERWEVFRFSPQTLMRWHRELVKAKWTFKRTSMGRPPISAELRDLIISMAKNSSDWGCYRVKGELRGLGARSCLRIKVTRRGRGLGSVTASPAPRPRFEIWVSRPSVGRRVIRYILSKVLLAAKSIALKRQLVVVGAKRSPPPGVRGGDAICLRLSEREHGRKLDRLHQYPRGSQDLGSEGIQPSNSQHRARRTPSA